MRALASLLCLLLLVPALARAEEAPPPPTARAVWTDAAPVIDGRLDPGEGWDRAPTAGSLVERKPKLRAAPPVRTTIRVLFDARALYVLVVSLDDQPVVARTSNRDRFTIFDDDAISLKLDSANDRRTTRGFVLNPVGARLDYRGVDESSFRVEHDAVWRGAAAVRPGGGWVAEFALPWEALGITPSQAPDAVGFNVSRDHARRNATYDWALMPPPFSPISASLYGRLEGLDELRRRSAGGSNQAAQVGEAAWSLVPYGLIGFRRAGSPLDAEPATDVGLDASARLGRWRTVLSLNTDFAQVDLDDRVVNLTRFGLFLPEKRDFFLTDVELFQFGESQEAQGLHTRRIGLRGGDQVPILAGVKLVGRPHEDVRVGLLQVTTRSHSGAPWSSHLVARGLVELGGGSNVGVLFTHRQSLEDAADRNLTVGLDGAWRGGGSPLLVRGFGLMSLTGEGASSVEVAAGGPGAGGFADRVAPGLGVVAMWRGELVRPAVRYLALHPELRSDLGFYRRVGVHSAAAEVAVEPRIGSGGLEKLTLEADVETIFGWQDLGLLDWEAGASATLVWEAGYRLGVDVDQLSEDVTSDFTVGRSTTIAAGRYDQIEVELSGSTPSTRIVSFTGSARYRDYYGGVLLGAEMSVVVNPGTLLRVAIGGTYDHVSFEDGRTGFDSAVVNSRIALGLSRQVGIDLFGAWDRLDDEVQLQARLRWIWRPGSDLFVVYQLDLDDDRAVERFQTLLVKLTMRWP